MEGSQDDWKDRILSFKRANVVDATIKCIN